MLRYLHCGTTACDGLRMALLQDFATENARLKLQVLELFGKLLSGPWMRKFYTSGESDISHIQGIGIIKVVIKVMREEMADPARLLASTSRVDAPMCTMVDLEMFFTMEFFDDSCL